MLFKLFPLSKQSDSIPLFKNAFLEKLTHIHPLTPLLVFFPIISFLFYQSSIQLSLLDLALSFVGGFFFWTFLEYTMHRYAFHFEAKSEFGKKIIFLFHGIHHDYPKDFTRLVMPLSVSIPLSSLFYLGFYSLFGTHGAVVFCGMMTGYLIYDYIHFGVHYFQSKNPVFVYLKRYHLWHHYQQPEKGFGVSNPLWDYVFRTHPQKREILSQKESLTQIRPSIAHK